ncbi:transcriptional regulator [Desulfobacter hydrogenophilus]|uniref:Transcriptional regulator n=1 Tax=Desulfobacter hydrogenophilus TaxID=2291 RepID=A0A328FFR6_9BACT|nr:RNA-binding domain-containing protein [Desulfobacter hydrogenophilus]NDY71470.1 transcriptional regulator [Desulfobacter hydrogenophilus]QBH12206.1 transcriptional regulator [Desulfobacter hydrogenophilus]RAM03471.1 transcriptional regulator [Desulfobacter hydrogenophilus]
MLKTELFEIIANGENSGVEFKRDDIRPEQLAKEVVALVNFQGGKILLGVDDDGSISGLQRSDVEEWVMNVISEKVHPAILPFYEEIKIDERTIVAVLTFPQGSSKPYVRRHNKAEEVFIRVGSTSRLATREQQMRLYEIGGMLHTEVLPVSRTSSNDLDKVRIENYLKDIVNDPDMPSTDAEWENRLANIGFLTEPKGMCTIAGIVLFGKQPRQYLKQSGLRLFAFNSPDKEYKAELDAILDGPLAARWDFTQGARQLIDEGLIESVLQKMDPFISEELDKIAENFQREKQYLYPIEAIREVLINALVHRDWTRFVDIEIGIYSDRLEVISPGCLQNSMTVEKMIAGQRYTRNTIIMEIMRDYGYVDFRGMGLRTKVIPLMRSHNDCDPIFEATEDYLKVILPRRKG